LRQKTKNVSPAVRIQRLVDQGMISGIDREKSQKPLPQPIPLSNNIAQKYLQEDRGNA